MDTPLEHALNLMSQVPLVGKLIEASKSSGLIRTDGHNDWANTIRGYYHNQLDNRFDEGKTLIGHVDLERLIQGRSGGVFMSAYVDW